MRRRVVAVVIMVVVGLAAAWVLAPWYWLPSLHDQPFDSARWKAEGNWKLDNPRGQMLRSLLSSHRLVGMSARQIVTLLGPPDEIDGQTADTAPLPSANCEYWYALGQNRHLPGADPDIMKVVLDGDSVCKRWYVTSS